MNPQPQNIWDTLQQAGLVQGTAPISNNEDSPWFVKVLLAFSGWLASIFLLFFLGLSFNFLFDESVIAIIFAIIMIGAAYALLRIRGNVFFEHVALAVSLAGQAIIFWQIMESLNNVTGWYLIALMNTALAIFMPNFVHRVFSAYFGAFCFSMALTGSGLPYIAGSIVMLIAAWIWLHEFDYPKHMRKLNAIGYGLVLALIQIEGLTLFDFRHFGWRLAKITPDLWIQPWIGELIAGAIMFYVVWQILKRLGRDPFEPTSIVIFVVTLILCMMSIEARGITTGMLILLLGFSCSNRILMGLGIISLLFYISSYYYLLSSTLLFKSFTLLIVGLVLMTARWLLLRMAHTNKETQHG